MWVHCKQCLASHIRKSGKTFWAGVSILSLHHSPLAKRQRSSPNDRESLCCNPNSGSPCTSSKVLQIYYPVHVQAYKLDQCTLMIFSTYLTWAWVARKWIERASASRINSFRSPNLAFEQNPTWDSSIWHYWYTFKYGHGAGKIKLRPSLSQGAIRN